MTAATQPTTNAFQDVWISFRSLPVWVQFWVALILMPVNMASLFSSMNRWDSGSPYSPI